MPSLAGLWAMIEDVEISGMNLKKQRILSVTERRKKMMARAPIQSKVICRFWNFRKSWIGGATADMGRKWEWSMIWSSTVDVMGVEESRCQAEPQLSWSLSLKMTLDSEPRNTGKKFWSYSVSNSNGGAQRSATRPQHSRSYGAAINCDCRHQNELLQICRAWNGSVHNKMEESYSGIQENTVALNDAESDK